MIEDADHLLMARANGNVDLHRFLAIADGVVRAQGRKIIFTTNLPNVGDIDDALALAVVSYANWNAGLRGEKMRVALGRPRRHPAGARSGNALASLQDRFCPALLRSVGSAEDGCGPIRSRALAREER